MAIAGALTNFAGRLFAANAGVVEKVAGGLDKLAAAGKNALSSVTGLATSLTGGLLAPLDAVREMVQSIGGLVGLFNPGILMQFQLTLSDTLAVLGAALVPVLQGATIYVRAFGDSLASLLPVIQPLFNAIGQYIANFSQGLLPIIQAAAPFIELFTDAMVALLDKVSQGVAFLQGIVAGLIKMVADLFGLESDFRSGASSKGFAARQTKVSSVEQFAADLFASTARNIYARQTGAKTPESHMEEIKKAIQEGKAVAKEIELTVKAILRWLEKRGNDAGDFMEGAQDIPRAGISIPGIGDFIRGFLGMSVHKPW